MTDAELIRRVQRGDLSAWTALYERHLPTLWRYVYGRADGDRHLAEDVVGETVLALVRGIRELDPAGGSLAGWLMQVARNKLVDHRRKSSRDAEELEGRVAQRANPNARCSPRAMETRARVIEVMDRLADEERLILEWKYVERRSVREIADRIGRTPKAVESLLYRARRSFRSLFECE